MKISPDLMAIRRAYPRAELRERAQSQRNQSQSANAVIICGILSIAIIIYAIAAQVRP